MMKVLALTILCLLVAVNEAKVFTKCELAKVLNQQGMNGYRGVSLPNWICLTNYESGFNTTAVGPPNSDGSRDFGIFQINSRWWCSGYGETSNGCNMPCDSLTTDDITDDIECAKRVVRNPSGIDAWVAWKNHCRGKDLSSWMQDCSV